MNGVIFDLKRFAVHDGRGIRSTLFLKGCPLRCPWCQNPEGLSRELRLWHQPATCIRCGTCTAACPEKALSLTERVRIDREKCTLCGVCAERCPTGALSLDGREISAEQAAELLLRDLPFFGNGGGITLSGGEATAQPEFALEVLRLCRERGAGTAMETCLFAPWETISRFLPYVDYFLTDLKLFDPEEHLRATGVPNAPILANFRALSEAGADILARTPLIPGFTDTEENIRSIARFVVSVNREIPCELLNYNPLCRSKYAALDEEYPVSGGPLSEERMEAFRAILREEGVRHIVKES